MNEKYYIQIVLMDGRKFINKYNNFDMTEQRQAVEFITAALLDVNTSIIEISKWVKTTNEATIPSKNARQ